MLLRRIVSDDDSNELFCSHVLDLHLHFPLRVIPPPPQERTRTAILINTRALCMHTALFALIYTVFSFQANRVPCAKFMNSMSHIPTPRMLVLVIEMCLPMSIIWFSAIIIIVIIPGIYFWCLNFPFLNMLDVRARSLYSSALCTHVSVCKTMNNSFMTFAILRHRYSSLYWCGCTYAICTFRQTWIDSEFFSPVVRFFSSEITNPNILEGGKIINFISISIPFRWKLLSLSLTFSLNRSTEA